MAQFPQATGKVILYTTHGDLEIDLWCKEVPKGCKNFIQLCLEGYYDNCSFHRLIPNFMIQGGDPTGTGEGGKSIYGEQFQDEFHKKITFSTRGLLAYSNIGPNSNESQFFITLAPCPWLDNKNTIFGRVVGNTIYNLVAMNEVDTDTQDRPIIPITIKSTNVVISPFNITIQNQQQLTEEVQKEEKQSKQEKKDVKLVQKKGKNVNLLSFHEEDDVEETDLHQKIKSTHDALEDPRLKKELAVNEEDLIEKRKIKSEQEKKKQALLDAIMKKNKAQGEEIENITEQKNIKQQIFQNIPNEGIINQLELGDDDRKLLYYKQKLGQNGQVEYNFDQSSSSGEVESEIEDEQERLVRQQQKDEYEKLKAEYLQFKEHRLGTNNPIVRDLIQNDKKLMTNVEIRKARFLQRQLDEKKDLDLQAKLERLREKLNSEEVQQDKYHWLNHKLKFHVDSANAFQQVETKQKVQDYKAPGLD